MTVMPVRIVLSQMDIFDVRKLARRTDGGMPGCRRARKADLIEWLAERLTWHSERGFQPAQGHRLDDGEPQRSGGEEGRT